MFRNQFSIQIWFIDCHHVNERILEKACSKSWKQFFALPVKFENGEFSFYFFNGCVSMAICDCSISNKSPPIWCPAKPIQFLNSFSNPSIHCKFESVLHCYKPIGKWPKSEQNFYFCTMGPAWSEKPLAKGNNYTIWLLCDYVCVYVHAFSTS